MEISPDGKKIFTKVVDENNETTSMSYSAVIWDAETGNKLGRDPNSSL
jgi:hypothetical protein